jgi:hypothetical protein
MTYTGCQNDCNVQGYTCRGRGAARAASRPRSTQRPARSSCPGRAPPPRTTRRRTPRFGRIVVSNIEVPNIIEVWYEVDKREYKATMRPSPSYTSPVAQRYTPSPWC